MTHLDQSSLDNLLDTWSGNRQKVTPEGFKNAYVGFSDKLKAFALLASMNGRGFRFSRADAADIAKSLTSYVLLDNLLTRNGYDKDSRPKLGATEIYSEVGPVSKPIVVGKYRDNMNNFIEELLNTDHVGAAMEGEWGDITNKANRALGSSDRNNTRIDSDNIINNTTNIPPDNPLEVSRKIHKSIPFFEQALQKSILNNQDQFMQFLASKAGTLLGDIGKGVERKDIGDARQALQAFQGT
jgi:hypothetical protein